MTDLNALLLYDNNITGALPPTIDAITDLQVLWLSNNSMAGAVPASVSKLRVLQYFFLEQNGFDGAVEAKGAPGEGKLSRNTCDVRPLAEQLQVPAPGVGEGVVQSDMHVTLS